MTRAEIVTIVAAILEAADHIKQKDGATVEDPSDYVQWAMMLVADVEVHAERDREKFPDLLNSWQVGIAYP